MEFITVRTFQNYFPAHILLTKLQSGGIECYLRDESIVSVTPFLSGAIGGIKLVVRKEDGEEVALLLEQIDEDFRKTAVCPKCGNNTIDRVPKQSPGNIFTAILSFFLGDLAISVKNVYHCSSCNFESENLPEPFCQFPVFEEERLN